jgi:thymidine phosphorylase
MKTLPAAQELARWLREIGQFCGLNLHLSITDMSQPLGRAVGNALEVKEAIRVLKGEKGRLRDVCVHFAGMALTATGRGSASDAEKALDSGAALAKAKEWFAAQGADLGVFESEDWCSAKDVSELRAEQSGWVSILDAQTIGQAVVDMGGGRKMREDYIDSSVGIVLHAAVGDRVEKGQLLAELHGPIQDIGRAFEMSDTSVPARSVVIE